ncbi:MAG: four helix bundle protein [Treponema sp.]|nr:four helix bundle protein [Treponema sp.]
MSESIVAEKSKKFAIKIIRLYKSLCDEKHEYVLSKQVLRSATSIGANICEAQCGQSKADFYAKMYISYKESAETKYWLELLHETDYISDSQFDELNSENQEILKILAKITKSQRNC